LYLFNLPDSIPPFSLPLQSNDREPIVDLQAMLKDVYDRSGYDYFIDYRSIVTPLCEADLVDANALKRLR